MLSAITQISSKKYILLVWPCLNFCTHTDTVLVCVLQIHSHHGSHYEKKKVVPADRCQTIHLGWRAAGTRCVPPFQVSWLQAVWGWMLGWSWHLPCCRLLWGSPAPGWPYTDPAGRQMSSPRYSPPRSHTLPPDTGNGKQVLNTLTGTNQPYTSFWSHQKFKLFVKLFSLVCLKIKAL